MISRHATHDALAAALERSRVVALLGPRQCGKTTLARTFVSPDSLNYFDLEDPLSLARLDEPMTTLRDLRGIVVIDEVQRRPELFPVLRVLADRTPLPARFLILGSASPDLLRQSSESLAGRIETNTIGGFTIRDVGMTAHDVHWLRGGFPLAFLADSDADSVVWRKNFIQTFLERDIPSFGIRTPAATLLRFWTMLAHYHGQVWNAAEPARSLGIGETSIRRYLDLLEGVFMIRQLQPWHENLKKRQVKSPKIYIRDSGLLHQLLGIRTMPELLSHPKCGASWEGYIIEEIITRVQPDEIYFWATHAGAELDLLMFKDGRRIGVEIKRADAPRLTPSMRTALEDLRLDRLLVLYPGGRRYPLSEGVEVVPFAELCAGNHSLVLGESL
ncbi:ATP-binding protein [Geobacter grbiciae]|uniref:ATP-binding protein n=1 Tax=Geobacter grbiciae TaxID=155042 RepID=UPI001C00E808|nr:ATP-binding protein [Geobacter grbiciae]MBT1073725.1 ATP-binding protein [Geobacter grbiciae]